MEHRHPRVVLVGAGFGGLYAAKQLGKAKLELTVVDQRNYHLFQPLLYQVATAELDASDIAVPIRAILRKQKNTDVMLGKVLDVDTQEKKVVLDDRVLPYDFLIIATGAHDSYFGHPDWEGHAPGLKSIENALEVRRRVFLAFEEAERELDPEKRKEWMTFVLVGGGPTGVEMAGALAEIAHHALTEDFRRINPHDARIILVEGHPHLLPYYPDELSESARKTLQTLGVEVRTGVRVKAIDEGSVLMGDEQVKTRTVLWSAGVMASALGSKLHTALDSAGRVKVTPYLTLPDHDDVFVVGDLAHVEQEGKVVPGIAPAAIQMGKHSADNIVRKLNGEAYTPFVFNDRGTFAVIGRGSAVGIAFGHRVRGFLAWLSWFFIHLIFLVGFRNRISVMAKWAYAFVTMRRYARLITGPTRTSPAPKGTPPYREERPGLPGSP